MAKGILYILIVLLFATGAQAGEVRLSVAASLKDAMNELSDLYARQQGGVRFVKNYGASGTLAKQIDNGAPADIFISANQVWMDYLTGKKLVNEASVGTLAFNSLVFAGRVGQKKIGMRDLVRLERIAIGSPKSVPAGEYAMEALARAGIVRQVERKLVMARDVREALMYAERGEVDGAFVYRTDALQGKRTTILFTVPPEFHPQISYPMGMTVAGEENRDAVGFFRFLRSGAARTVLEKYGFAVR